jgi:hypothetical protein
MILKFCEKKTIKMPQVQPSQGKPRIASWECLKMKMAKIKQSRNIVFPFCTLLP